jgi:hypothetical protein
VALGAPLGEVEEGEQLVITHSLITIVLKPQSVPSPSCSEISKSVPCRASEVNCAATSPIDFTVIENVIDFGE